MKKQSVLKGIILLSSIVAQGAVSNWPTASDWEPIYSGSDYYLDYEGDAVNTGADDDNIDIVGDAAHSAGFKLLRTENGEEQLLFRMRLDAYRKANQPENWQIYFSTDSTPGMDFALELTAGLNNSGTNQWLVSPFIRFTTIANNSTSDAVELSTTNIWESTNGALYAKWGPNADTSFNFSTDVFLNLAMPASVFFAATGLAPDQPYSIILATSQTTGRLTGDIGMHPGPIGSAGTVDITQYETPRAGYVTGIGPDSGGQLGGFQVTISGTDLTDGLPGDITSVTLNGVEVTSIDSISATQIVVTAAAAISTGTGDIVITSTAQGVTTKTNAFTYLYEAATHTLTVVSAHGSPSPSGTSTHDKDSVLNPGIDAEIINGTTRYVCTGWSMTGCTPPTGTGNSFSMSITNDAVLTWQWATNYWIDTAAGTNGSISTPGWVEAGTTLYITPEPDTYYEFTGWSGDASGSDTPLALLIDGPKSVTANYTATLTVGTQTPLWWLAQYGYTNNFEAAASDDPDGDGYSNWEEYIAGTAADSASSRLRITEEGTVPAGQKLSWPCSAGREYTVLWGTNLLEGVTNVLVSGYVTPETGTAVYTDAVNRVESSLFYRLTVKVPAE